MFVKLNWNHFQPFGTCGLRRQYGTEYLLDKSLPPKPQTVTFVLLYIHYLILGLVLWNKKVKKGKKGSFSQESEEKAAGEEVKRNHSAKNDGEMDKENFGEKITKKYHEPQMERTKSPSWLHSLIEIPVLFTSEVIYLQESIRGCVQRKS